MMNRIIECTKKQNIKALIIKSNVATIKEVINNINALKLKGLPKIYIIGKHIKEVQDEKEKLLIMNDFHVLPTAGHAGIKRTLNTIQLRYYWKGMSKDIDKFKKNCKQCQVNKLSNTKIPMKITTTAESAFETIYLEIVGPLIKSEGYEYILTTQCELSKFITATPIHDKSTLTVANAFVTNVILKYGVPKTKASDRGTEFMSELFTNIAKILEIQKLNSTAYHHQSFGALENSHKALGTYLRMQCNGKLFTWSE